MVQPAQEIVIDLLVISPPQIIIPTRAGMPYSHLNPTTCLGILHVVGDFESQSVHTIQGQILSI